MWLSARTRAYVRAAGPNLIKGHLSDGIAWPGLREPTRTEEETGITTIWQQTR